MHGQSGQEPLALREYDNRKPLSFDYNGDHGGDSENSSRHGFNPGFTWRATSSMSLNMAFATAATTTTRSGSRTSICDNGGQHYVFGRIDQQTLSFNTRFNYTMTPTLVVPDLRRAVRVGRPIQHYKELANGRAEQYDDRYRPYAYDGNADFNFRSFRTTNVLRWEYKPGSALFLVWQQGKSGDGDQGDFRFGRDFGGVFSAPSRNVFLVKFSYWLNM